MNRAKQVEQIYRICNDIQYKGDYSYYIGYNSEKFIEVSISPKDNPRVTVVDIVVHFNEGNVEENQKILINKLLNFKRYGK